MCKLWIKNEGKAQWKRRWIRKNCEGFQNEGKKLYRKNIKSYRPNRRNQGRRSEGTKVNLRAIGGKNATGKEPICNGKGKNGKSTGKRKIKIWEKSWLYGRRVLKETQGRNWTSGRRKWTAKNGIYQPIN